MAENIIRVVFEDNTNNANSTNSTNAGNTGNSAIFNSNTGDNNSPLNNTITASEALLNTFSAKLQQSAELIKSLSAQTKVSYTNIKKAAANLDPLDSKSVTNFNKVLKESTQDNIAISKQFKKVNKSLAEFNKQLKNTKQNSDNNQDKPNNSQNKNANNNNIISTLAKTGAISLPFYYAAHAFENYASINALDYGNNLMNPLAYASQRRNLQYEQNKNISGGIGAILGSLIGSAIPGIGTAIGLGVGAVAGSQLGNLGYSYFGGQDNAQDQLQYEVSQNYANLKRGNLLSQQLASLYGNTFSNNNKATKSTQSVNSTDNMFLLPQFLQMSNMNQYGGNLSNSDLAGIAKISSRYNANPNQIGSLLAQINANTKNMQTTLLTVDAHAQKTGGDIVSQLAVAVQLMQKGGLSAPDAINKAFNQSLYGTTYAGAQNGYFQSSYINQYRLRALGRVANIDVEGIMQGKQQSINKFNQLQIKAQNDRLNPDANTLLVNMIAQNLGLGNGTINTNPVNQNQQNQQGNPNSSYVPYTDIYKKLSNSENVQKQNYKGLGINNPDSDLYGEMTGHNSAGKSASDELNNLTTFMPKVINKGKQYAKQGLTYVLAKEYMDNMQLMEADKQSGNMTDYHKLEQLNRNLEMQIKALNKNTQALQQKNAGSISTTPR